MDSSSTHTRITLNVGGVRFMTTTDALQTFPHTRLGRLATTKRRPDEELFFDRNPDLMNSLLDLYRTGELHLPKHLCARTTARELAYWEIPEELIRECCYKAVEEHKEDVEIVAEIDKFLVVPFDEPEDLKNLSVWNRIWLTMERPGQDLASKIWSFIFFIFVFLSVLFYAFQTNMKFREFYPDFVFQLAQANLTVSDVLPFMDLRDEYEASRPKPWLWMAEVVVFAFFLTELLVRFVTCPVKRCFLRQPKTWFDVFMLIKTAVTFTVESYLEGKETFTSLEVNGLTFFYSLTVLRVLRILYLAKHFDCMKILLLSTRASLKVLLLLVLCLVSLACIFGSAVFLTEMLSETYTVSSIPYGCWYAIVTMTTVGYGDVVPESSVGRLTGVLCAFCGVIVMALPVAVIASKFSSYHDNVASRKQMKTRLQFLRTHPGFSGSSRAGDEASGDKSPETLSCRSLSSLGRENLHQRSGLCLHHGEREGGGKEQGKKTERSKASWFGLGLFQRRRRRRSHPIVVKAAN